MQCRICVLVNISPQAEFGMFVDVFQTGYNMERTFILYQLVRLKLWLSIARLLPSYGQLEFLFILTWHTRIPTVYLWTTNRAL